MMLLTASYPQVSVCIAYIISQVHPFSLTLMHTFISIAIVISEVPPSSYSCLITSIDSPALK